MNLLNTVKNLNHRSSGFSYFPFKSALQPYIALLILTVAVYFNTFRHEVAFDDESVLHKNEFVMMGVKGIPGILTHDSYYSYYKQLGIENSLPAGRYRPLSQITFAIEQEFIGTIPNGIVTETSWDINKNGVKDSFEDTNHDGLYTDYDFWSKGSGMRHVINVLLYALLVLLIYHVLVTNFFASYKDFVFFALLLFSVHPLHTEVVANIKSRDEILSLLLIFSTMHFTFRYVNNFQKRDLIYTALFMLLSLLSKEYAVLLFVLIPAVLFVYVPSQINFRDSSFWIMTVFVLIASFCLIKFFNQGTLVAVPVIFIGVGYYFAKIAKQAAGKILYALGAALLFYLALRFSATTHDVSIATFDDNIISNPYLMANEQEKWASKISVWLKYIQLFFTPSPLLVDYSFKTIPYSSFNSPAVWISVVFYTSMIIWLLYSFLKKSVLFFPLLIFIGFFIPIANVFVDIGATMGERLFFHSSLGLSILVSFLIFYLMSLFSKINWKWPFLILAVISTTVFSALTFSRNPVWKNNISLFLNDVNTAPENINILAGAGIACYDLSVKPENKAVRRDLGWKANQYYNRALAVYSKHYPVYLNKTVNFINLNELDSALACTDVIMRVNPNAPNIKRLRENISERYMFDGVRSFEKGNKKIGMELLLKSLKANKNNDRAWNNMGKALIDAGAKEKAITCFVTALQINPENKIAKEAVDRLKKDE